MKYIRPSRFLSFLVSISLLIAPLPLSAIAQDLIIDVSHLALFSENHQQPYIYVGKELSNVKDVLSDISILDNDITSPIAKFIADIDDGLLLVSHDDMADILQYAESVIQKKGINLDIIKVKKLYADLDDIIEQFLQGSLSVRIRDKYYDENAKRSYVNIITVQGLLSVNDEVVQRITAVDLSATDAIIQNATINSLSTTNLSVVDLTVTGTLSVNDEVVNNTLVFNDASGGEYVGLQAPAVIPSSYLLTLPSTTPTANQILRANSVTPTNLEWATSGGSVVPSVSKTIYVTKYGNDTTGDGSFTSPFASLSKAITTANGIASSLNPIVILVSAGIYTENNSAGALTITANGISIVGESASSVIITPNTPANDLLSVGSTIRIANLTFQSSAPLATGINLIAGSLTVLNSVRIFNFLTGVSCSGGAAQSYGFDSCLFVSNGTALAINNSRVETNTCSIFGTSVVTGPAVNTGIEVTGSGASIVLNAGVIALCQTGMNVINNAIATANSINFRLNAFDTVQNTASRLTLAGCTFELTDSSADIDVQVSDAGTIAEIISCEFSGASSLGTTQGTGIIVSNNGTVNISGGVMHNYTTGIEIGDPSDTSSTICTASGLIIRNCTTDLLQQGTSTLLFDSSTASSSKIIINDATNVDLAFFDLEDNGALTIGSTTDQDTGLIQVDIDSINQPGLNYKSVLYSTQAMGFENTFGSSSSLYSLSANNTDLTAITTDRTKIAGVRLVSDEGAPVGGTSALRGWDINKNSSAAELSFTYQNSDIVGQSAVSPYIVMQLDGVNNQLQLPSTNTRIVFATDTNLYRSAANVLKTDDNFIVGTLTPDRVVVTDSITNQLASSTVTTTELGYLSGVTSSIQTQLNGKVAKAGDTMTGALQLPAGTAAAPSLRFTGSTTTGLSAATANTLSLDTNGTERLKIDGSGNVTINGFNTAGVVHNDSSGLLSSSLIVNADVAAGAGIVDTKLATISTAGKVANSATTATSSNTPNTIVLRDGSGNFAAGTITANLIGNATTATTSTNFSGSLLGDVIGTQSATVVSTVGGRMAADIAAATDLVSAATSNNTANTIVLRNPSGNFSAGAISVTDEVISNSLTITPFNTAGVVHNNSSGLLSSSLIVNADVAAGAAIVDTKLATISTAGKVANSATTATSSNTPNTIVLRDGSGNFAAGTITANLSGNATTATTATNFSGSLSGDVTGTQSATVVSFVGGQTAANIAAATVLANAATSANTASTIVRRTASGGFSAGAISVIDEVISNSLTITPFNTAGVVHNNASGLLSSSLIVNGDITNATISNAKLATISSSNTPGNIVVRDGSGNFATNMITIAGTTTNATDVATKSYVDSAVSTGLVAKDPAAVVSTSNETLSGLPTIDGVTLVASDRVLLTGQTDPIENGLWVVQAGAWTRPTDFNTGDLAGQAYVLILSGTLYGGSSWLCNTPTAVIDTDPIGFALFSLPNTTTGANVGTGTGLIFRDKTGSNINFKSLIQGSHIIITNNTNDIDLATDATNTNTASTIVARDASGDFSAGIITASLSGNATTATTATNFSGSLSGDVTGTQGATIVSLVGGQTATNVAAATVLANAATSANTASTIVKRTASGGFSAGEISVTDEVISNNITILPFNAAGIVHNDSSGLLSSSLIVNADVDPAAAIVDTKLATISTAGKVANSATTATSANTASAIVARDGSGNFSAGTITANLSGNATTATTATNFSGSLSGEVTGTQSTTVVSNAVSANTANAIVRRTATGGFSAGTISVTDQVISNSATITPFSTAGVVHNNASGLLSSSLIVNADVDSAAAIVDTKLATISTAGKVANSATTATSANTASAIVARDASGNFSAGTITANLSGNATTATTATNFSGSLSGEVTGTQSATVVSNAVSANTASAIVRRTASGGFSAGTISVTDEVISNSATITPFSTAGIVHNNSSGLLSSSLIVNADVDAAAAIVDTKLATISTAGKVANSATTATSANTANAIVARDASGNFNAGTIIASLTGAASLNVLKAGDTMTGALQLPAGTTALPSLIFTGSTTTGLSTNAGALSFSTSALERLKISSGGTISVNAFTSAGVVHNDASGNLSSSLVVNADVDPAAAIVDTKLATISTAGKVANSATTATSANTANAIVARDASGNFSTNMITLNGTTTNPTDAATKAYVDAQIGATGTNLNTPNTLVLRDGTGSFAAQVISMTDGVHSGNLILSTEPSTSTAGNILKGSNRFIHNFGTNNTFVGINAGNFTLSGLGNIVGVGTNALTANTTGAYNTAVGSSSLAANTIGTQNTAIGYNALSVNTTGTDNTAVGFSALAVNTTGTSFNTAVGSNALADNTTGTNNTAVGFQSLTENITGSNNTAVGSNSLGLNTTGSNNTAVGRSSLTSNTIGTNNTAVGFQALTNNTTGIQNVAVGQNSLAFNTIGTGNTAVGTTALQFNSTGANNTAIGLGTLAVNTIGTDNTAVGYLALNANTTGTSNVGIGRETLPATTTGSNNIAIGTNAGSTLTTGSGNIYLNANAATAAEANTTRIGTSQTACYVQGIFGATTPTGTPALVAVDSTGKLGTASLTATSSNTPNTIVQRDGSGNFSAGTITANLSGNATTATTATNFSGSLAGEVTGTQSATVVSNAVSANTASAIVRRTASGGFSAGTISMTDAVASGNLNLTTEPSTSTAGNILKNGSRFIHDFGTNSTFVGLNAGNFTTTGSSNTGIGFNAFQSNTTGNNNVAVGNSALQNNTFGSSNIAIGVQALLLNTTGSSNTAMGLSALQSNTTGSNNTGLGTNALLNNTTGGTNTAVGSSALTSNTIGTSNTAIGVNSLTTNTTGTNNTAVGAFSIQFNTTGINNTAIGLQALQLNTIGSSNCAMGVLALTNNTTASDNTAVGFGALQNNTTGNVNTAVGKSALQANTIGQFNTAVGQIALTSNTTGISNTAVGQNCLTANTTGSSNTALGSATLPSNTGGSNNTAIGFNALPSVSTGNNNIALGVSAGAGLTTGSGNIYLNANAASSSEANTTRIGTSQTACYIQGISGASTGSGTAIVSVDSSGKLGTASLISTSSNTANAIVQRDGSGDFSSNTINLAGNLNLTTEPSTSTAGNILKNGSRFIHNFGTNSTFVGLNAGNFTTTGSSNTGIGFNAFQSNTTGNNNVAVGNSALQNNTFGSSNIAIGVQALLLNTTGSSNIAMGLSALQFNTIGSNNTAIGANALLNNTTGGTNTAVGSSALASNTIGTGNTAVGVNSITSNTTGINNTGLGVSAIQFNTTGINNTAIGLQALQLNTIGSSNCAMGVLALANNTTASDNTAVGFGALQNNTTGNVNTAVGKGALQANTTGTQNTAVGSGALASNTNGVISTAVGWNALNAATGGGNTAVGAQALATNTTGFNNVAMGGSSLLNVTTGTNNTAMGESSMQALTTGSNNIAIGQLSGGTLATGSGNIYINANAGATNEATTTRIGTSQTRAFIAGIRGVTTGNANAIAVLIDSAGQLGTTSSSRNVKHNIQDMNDDSANIYQLRPVTFAYNSDASETKQYGLIAEEVDEVFPAIVATDADGNPESVQYHILPVLLLNELKKQQVRLTEVEKQQQITIEQMNAAIAHLQNQIQKLTAQR